MITKEQVYEALHECYDPEIPVNIVDLGLVYDVQVDDGDNVAVKMTLTAPGCGMGTMIAADARQRILALEGVGDATVDLVWDPPWNPSMISEEAKQKLGIGYLARRLDKFRSIPFIGWDADTRIGHAETVCATIRGWRTFFTPFCGGPRPYGA